MDPTRTLYTRQQMAQLTGLDDTVLNYWSREGLLVPTQGGEGRGSHRKFDFLQINIAAIFGQIRRFRLNIEVMRSLAVMLQEAVRIGKLANLHPGSIGRAAHLANKLDQFRQGVPVMIPLHGHDDKPPANLRRSAYTEWLTAKRPATDEAEVISDVLDFVIDHDSVSAVLAAARAMGPGKETEAQLYAELVYDLLAPGYSGAYSWLLGFDADDNWRIEFAPDGGNFFSGIASPSPEAFGPGIFLPVSGIFRTVWGLKQPRQYMMEKRVENLEAVLAEAGIVARLRIDPDDGETFSIDAPDADWDRVQAVLDEAGYRLSLAGGPEVGGAEQ